MLLHRSVTDSVFSRRAHHSVLLLQLMRLMLESERSRTYPSRFPSLTTSLAVLTREQHTNPDPNVNRNFTLFTFKKL